MTKLKEKLLSCDLVVDNEYLDLYVSIINNNLTHVQEKDKTQKHHIIPRYWFKYNKIKIDNSSENIVNLDFIDHVKAHYYLLKCSKNDVYKTANMYALIRWIKTTELTEINLDDTFAEEYAKIQQSNRACKLGTHHKTSEETKQKISNSNKGINKNKIYIYKDDEEKRIYPSELSYYSSLGYVKGRSLKTLQNLSKNYNYSVKGMLNKSQTEYQKRKASESLKNKKKSPETCHKMSESKRQNEYVCLRDCNNKYTIRVKPDNVDIYIKKGYTLCK